MADMRRRRPEPPPGPPQIQLKPGLAKETLRELAPLLAEEGIDVDNIDVPDLDTLQAAMKRAVERHNMTRFTPVGHARDLAVTTLRLVIEALADGNTALAAAILEQVQPDSPDNTAPTVAGCIGVALGLLDDWLTGSDPHTPSGLGQRVKLPAGHWLGERAATDILVLARKGRAFGSLDTLIARQGGKHVLYGAALTLAAAVQAWAAATDTPVTELAPAWCSEHDYHPRTSATVLRRWLESALSRPELDRRGAELLFQVLTEREEGSAIGHRQQQAVSGWTKSFTAPRLLRGHCRPAHLRRAGHRTGTTSYRLAHAPGPALGQAGPAPG
jgi:hypothetical protein